MRNKKYCLLLVMLLFTVILHAEEPDTFVVHKVISKYQNENAVYLSIKKHLIIDFENGQLTAREEDNLQKLFLTDVASSLYSREDLSYTFMNDLAYMPTGTAYVPKANGGYKWNRCTQFGGYKPTTPGTFYDDVKGLAVLYSGLTKNSITETKYTKICTDVNMLPDLFMQASLPIAKCVIEITAPSFVDIGYVLKDADKRNIKISKSYKNNNVTYRFVTKDVPAYKSFDGVPSVYYYFTHIIPFIKSYTLPGDHRSKQMLNNVEGLYKHIYKFVKYVNIAEDRNLSRTVEQLVINDATPRQKTAHIYEWVQKNIHYVGFEDSLGGFYPRQASLVFQRKFGDCKDMSSILVAMLRKAGIKAYYTWVGTTRLPYTAQETPLPSLFDHMICAVNIDNDWIFVDGTDNTLPLGKNRDDIQGKEALIAINEKDFKLIKVPVADASDNLTNDTTTLRIISHKSITGRADIKYKGSAAYEMAQVKLLTKDEQRDWYIRYFTKKGSNKYLVDNYDFHVETDGNRDASIIANFNLHDYVQNAKGQYVLNMNINRDFENIIDTTGRNVDYYFTKKEKTKETVILELPKGMHLVHLPNASKGVINNVLSYNISYKHVGNKIILSKEFELKTLSVSKKDFVAYNKVISNLRKQYKESVILSGKLL